MISGIFISGTGTGVGKTMVTTGVVRYLLSKGAPAMVMKPVQTGCRRSPDGLLRAPDVEFVLRATGLTPDEETAPHLAPYLFEPACSPHLAARMAGQNVTMVRILNSAEWLARRYEPLVVEGAGGLAVPLNERELMLDLIAELALPVLLVGHSGLGTINHTLLSIEALRRRDIRVAGIVLNETQPVFPTERYIHDDNLRTIIAMGEIASVTRIPYLGQPPRMELLDVSFASAPFLRELFP
jgi:dethiobiotin synthase